MNPQYTEKYLALQGRAMEDEYYLSLVEEYRFLDKKLLSALEEMAPIHRDAVMDYLGAVHAANARMVELALVSGEKC
jgi:hypothetical protein